ncbi:SNF5/SMARCB1/INI1 protein [Phytophthora cactorum]|nr:SNF5/SMARCB1/INI1 protein [Phytophthora cactorum]
MGHIERLSAAQTFASTLCADLNLPKTFEPAIVFSIFEQVAAYRVALNGRKWIGKISCQVKSTGPTSSAGFIEVMPPLDDVVRSRMTQRRKDIFICEIDGCSSVRSSSDTVSLCDHAHIKATYCADLPPGRARRWSQKLMDDRSDLDGHYQRRAAFRDQSTLSSYTAKCRRRLWARHAALRRNEENHGRHVAQMHGRGNLHDGLCC